MKMNQTDRVTFLLPSRYFRTAPSKSGMDVKNCHRVLLMAFDLTSWESANLMKDNPEGFRIMCRFDQFGRFIYARAAHGECINGITDLEMNRVSSDDASATGRLAKELNLDHDAVRRVAVFMGIDIALISKRLPPGYAIDVSGRAHLEGYW